VAEEMVERSEREASAREQPMLPAQPKVFQMPRRFGHVPVDEAPLGWDKEKRFEGVYPRVELPFQEVERVTFGHPEIEPNRLYFGDCLHVMRMLPSESVDLIYIDPPFFSGKQYNLIFGDKSELRSFSDIWEGGLNGYLVWLNARLYEMKRLLKPTGSIYVHLDWHAAHYVKIEMDKIFGYDNFVNEVIWSYRSGGGAKRHFGRKHDTLLFYARVEGRHRFFADAVRVPYDAVIAESRRGMFHEGGKVSPDVWDISRPPNHSKEWIGYPTQKPRAVLDRVIRSVTEPGDVVADFFVGGGTTAEVAQQLERRWIACDISRVAVALTVDRVARVAEASEGREVQTTLIPTPDLTIFNWGTYEVDLLTEVSDEVFREFVVVAYGGRLATGAPEIHGYKGEPLFVGSPRQEHPIGVDEVGEFAKALLRRSGDDEAGGTMLGWAFTRDAQVAADRLLAQRRASLRFVRLKLVALEAPEYKSHVVQRSPQYEHLLTFVLPPAVRFSAERAGPRHYRFDASESLSLNAGGKIINVQWDFGYRAYFTSSPGFEFSRKKDVLALSTEYVFLRTGRFRVACRMQDDVGGQATAIREVEVS
jgi:DNA modification methylase